MTLTDSSGSNGVKITLPTLGGIVAVLGILAFLGGWVTSHITFRSDLTITTLSIAELRLGHNQLTDRINTMSKSDVDDRLALSTRLTSIEYDIRYTKQDVADIKLAILPKR